MLKKAFIVLLFVIAQPLVAACQNKTEAQQQPSANSDQSQAKPSVSIETKSVSQSAKTQGAPQDDLGPSENSPKVTDWAQAATSILILAVIIVQACIYRKQWEIMRRQWIA